MSTLVKIPMAVSAFLILLLSIPASAQNSPPVFTSNSSVVVLENIPTGTVALDVNANDGDGGADDVGITYSIDFLDADQFTIDSSTGEIRFISSPDFENPTDDDNSDGTFNTYLIFVTADDGSPMNNTTSQVFLIEVLDVDDTAPVPDIADLPTINAECELSPLPPTATDNVSGSITGVPNVSFPITESTTITWTYTDGSGNESTQSQEVVIADVTAPVPDNSILTTLGAECSLTSLTPPIATDNCEGTIVGRPNVALPITSSTTVTWTYIDGSGNISTQTQDVVVGHEIAPTPNQTNLSSRRGEFSFTPIAPTSTSNCGQIITGVSDTPFPITDVGVTIVTWTYEDQFGNESTQTQEVEILGRELSPFLMTFRTTQTNEEIELVADPSGINFDIDWGDGVQESVTANVFTHTYQDPGDYQIAIEGSFPGIVMSLSPDRANFISLDQWGDIEWRTMRFAFTGCSNTVFNATDIPDLSRVSSMEAMFQNIDSLDGVGISNWDLSSVTNMSGMFSGVNILKEDLTELDVSNVTNMSTMFGGSGFNQDVSSWDVSNVTNMFDLFTGSDMSVQHIDNLLNSWVELPLQNRVLFWNVGVNYCRSSEAIAMLDNDFDWRIRIDQNCDGQPEVASPVDDMVLNEGFTTYTIDLDTVFSDPDMEPFMFSASSSNEEVVTVAVSGSELIVTEGTLGTSMITIVADDMDDGVVSDTFGISMNAIPQVVQPIGFRILYQGFTTARLDIGNVFDDAESTNLTYSATVFDGGSVSVSLAERELVISELGLGLTDIGLIATDENGGVGFHEINIDVRRKLDQTINFEELPGKMYGDEPFGFDLQASSGLEVMLSSKDESVITIDGGTITIVGAGEAVVVASQAGNEIYNPAENVERTLIVNKAPLTIIADDQNKTYGAENPSLTMTFSGFLNGDDIGVIDALPAISTSANALSDVGQYEILLAGGMDNNYLLNYSTGLLNVMKAPLTVTADDQTIDQGSELPMFTIQHAGFVNDEDVSVLDIVPTANVSISDSSTPGNYDIVVSGGLDNNYDFSYSNGTLTIDEVLGLLGENKIKIYPNPVVDYLIVSSNEVSVIEVFDLRGMQVLSKPAKEKIDMTSLDEGPYIIHLRNGSGEIIYSGLIVKDN